MSFTIAPNPTDFAATGGVDLDDWTFRDLRAVIFYHTKLMLVLIARTLGVILCLIAVLCFSVLLIVGIVKGCDSLAQFTAQEQESFPRCGLQ